MFFLLHIEGSLLNSVGLGLSIGLSFTHHYHGFHFGSTFGFELTLFGLKYFIATKSKQNKESKQASQG